MQCRSERSEEPLRLSQRPFATAQGITVECVTSGNQKDMEQKLHPCLRCFASQLPERKADQCRKPGDHGGVNLQADQPNDGAQDCACDHI